MFLIISTRPRPILFLSQIPSLSSLPLILFFFYVTATPVIYTLSLHDALPIFEDPEDSGHKAFNYRTEPMWKRLDRKSTRLNSSHLVISYAVFCLKKKKNTRETTTPYKYSRHEWVARLTSATREAVDTLRTSHA